MLANGFRPIPDQADVLPVVQDRGDLHLDPPPAALNLQAQPRMRVPVNRVDYLFAAGHRPAVDRHDGVTVLQPGLFRRTRHPVARIEAVGEHLSDAVGHPTGHAQDQGQPGQQNERQQQVHHRPRRQDRHALPHRFRSKCVRAAAFLQILASELDVPAERHQVDGVEGLPACHADQLRPKPQRKCLHGNTHALGHEKMAQFVAEDHDAEGDDGPDQIS